MNANAEACLRGKKVVCSRCGAPMGALLRQDNGGPPLLRYRCKTGHVTQALPVPERLRAFSL